MLVLVLWGVLGRGVIGRGVRQAVWSCVLVQVVGDDLDEFVTRVDVVMCLMRRWSGLDNNTSLWVFMSRPKDHLGSL